MNGASANHEIRAWLPSFLEALPGPVIIVDANDRLMAANDAARALFPALRIGDLLALVLRAPDVLDAIARARDSGNSESVTWRERIPVERVFEVKVAPVTADRRAPFIVLSLIDLTESRRVERMRADFVANASHELRTPLASLLGFIETLQGAARDDSKSRAQFLDIMREQAQRMSRLIDDLLSLSRIEQNLHVRPQTPVDLVSIVEHVADTLRPMARDHGVDFAIEAPPEATVAGDRDELIRIVENLLENAVKYGAPKNDRPRRIDISVSAGNGMARLAVRDFGPGIASEHLPRLTERFYRVDAGQSRAKGGTGLGLAIVKHIVARHRGRLTIESQLGEGATFAVSMPLFRDAV